jgi:2'-5' RNA ligase
MKILILFFNFIGLLPLGCSAASRVSVSDYLTGGAAMPFIGHSGPGQWDSALAMNLPYEPAMNARLDIAVLLGQKLDYFKGWNPRGEAHITVITPGEYWDALRQKLTMAEINAIALDLCIQSSDVRPLGIGSGRAVLNGKMEETFFFISESQNLLRIRREIARRFEEKGGRQGLFDPEKFYPHITIGYTLRDLHIQDGVIKDIAHSMDGRMELRILR